MLTQDDIDNDIDIGYINLVVVVDIGCWCRCIVAQNDVDDDVDITHIDLDIAVDITHEALWLIGQTNGVDSRITSLN